MPFARLATVSGNERKKVYSKIRKRHRLLPYELLTATIRTFDCYHTNFWLLPYDHDTILLMPPPILNDTVTLSLLGPPSSTFHGYIRNGWCSTTAKNPPETGQTEKKDDYALRIYIMQTNAKENSSKKAKKYTKIFIIGKIQVTLQMIMDLARECTRICISPINQAHHKKETLQ